MNAMQSFFYNAIQTPAIINNLFCLLNSFWACAIYCAMRAFLKSCGVFVPFHLFHFTINLNHCGPFCIRTGLLSDASRSHSRTVTSVRRRVQPECYLRSVGASAVSAEATSAECCAYLTALTAFGVHAEFLPHWQITRIEGY